MQKRSFKFLEECTPFDRRDSFIALNTKILLGSGIAALSAARPHYNPQTTRQDHEPSIVTFERFDERLRDPIRFRRRIRRIIPAFIVMLAASSIAAVALFPPKELAEHYVGL
jgi:hypothetical protein